MTLGILLLLGVNAAASVFPAEMRENEDGLIAVYFSENDSMLITDVPVDALPEPDAQRIRDGIELPDQAAYTRAMEDFCS